VSRIQVRACYWFDFLEHVQFLTSHGKFLAQRVFHFPAGSNVSSYTQLYTAFLISGFVHSPPYNAGPLRFFITQAVGITFEDTVIALATRAGLGRSGRFHRLFGYVWVYCWFIYSMPSWMDCMTSLGTLESGGVKFSLVLGLYRGEWYPVRRWRRPIIQWQILSL